MPHSAVAAIGRRGLCALVFGTALLGSGGIGHAADFEDYGRYGSPRGYYEPHGEPRGSVYRAPPPYAPPAVVERRVEADESYCRVFHRRRIDPYGREVVHRVRVCDEGIVPRSRAWAEAPRNYGYEPRYDAPRPPRGVGREFEDEWE